MVDVRPGEETEEERMRRHEREDKEGMARYEAERRRERLRRILCITGRCAVWFLKTVISGIIIYWVGSLLSEYM